MPRGVMVIAETREEAEAIVRAETPVVRVLRSRELDLAGLPLLLPRHWVVVVEHEDPNEEARLPQPDHPEDECERETRLMYLTMAVDPNHLVSGVIEEFPCPECGDSVHLELQPPGRGPPRTRALCAACRTPLRRATGTGRWETLPAELAAPKTCAYCNARARSREHVIPEWISKQLGVQDFLSADDAFVVGVEPPRQPISFASYRARVLCKECNEHFGKLEERIMPLLVPMARGRPLSLGAESRALLALWAHKTAINLLIAARGSDDVVPAKHRHAVRWDARVGADTWVAFYAWTGKPVLGTGLSNITRRASTGVRSGYCAFLSFGQVGFSVVGLRDGLHPDETVGGDLRPLIQFWPPTTRRLQYWPPPVGAA
jgi:hypothetical protein